MNKNEFLQDEDVSRFVDWLVASLPKRAFRLRFSASRFVPGGLNADVVGLEQVLNRYVWRAAWSDNGEAVRSEDWNTTRNSLHRLRGKLLGALADGESDAMLAACFSVLDWGGVSSARPFLRRKAAHGQLIPYLRGVQEMLALDSGKEIEAIDGGVIERYDAGLTKIHALLDTSGLPIYDSRVGAAISMLYALYRAEAGADTPLPTSALRFPTGSARGVQIRNPSALAARFPAAPQFYTSMVPDTSWAQNQVRLGWILREVLARTDWFAHDGADLSARCHAFEAALFMLGYDLRCFTDGALAPLADMETPRRAPTGWVPTSHTFSTVFSLYADYRQELGARGVLYDDAQGAGFVEWWMQRPGHPAEGALRAYCFPLAATEFDLYERPLDDIVALRDAFDAGDTALIAGFLGDFAIQADERRHVCLIDAWCVGYLRRKGFNGVHSAEILIAAGFAGTANAAQTLCQVGGNVGRYLKLLDVENQPSQLFHDYFADKLDDLAEQLDQTIGGRPGGEGLST